MRFFSLIQYQTLIAQVQISHRGHRPLFEPGRPRLDLLFACLHCHSLRALSLDLICQSTTQLFGPGQGSERRTGAYNRTDVWKSMVAFDLGYPSIASTSSVQSRGADAYSAFLCAVQLPFSKIHQVPGISSSDKQGTNPSAH